MSGDLPKQPAFEEGNEFRLIAESEPIDLPDGLSLDLLNEAIERIRDWDCHDRMGYELAIELFRLYRGDRNRESDARMAYEQSLELFRGGHEP